jgi:hypothetical protein
MKRFGWLALLAVVAVLVATASVDMAAQSSTTPSKSTWTGKTPWGDPDIIGQWRGFGGVPFERPARYQGREFLTDAEVAAILKAQEVVNERTRRGENYEFFFRAQANLNEIFHYDEKIAPISRRTSQIIDPPDGRLPPLTPQVIKLWEERENATHGRGEADHWTDRAASERCIVTAAQLIPFGRVGYWGLGEPPKPRPIEGIGSVDDASLGLEGGGIENREDTSHSRGEVDRPTMRIFQSPGFVAMQELEPNGLWQEVNRIIPLDGRKPFGPNVRQIGGVSRGRWEGNTLVVETTNFLEPDPTFQTYGIRRYPGTMETLKIVERYTRIDANRMERRYTIEDPEVYTRPYTVMDEFTLHDDFVVGPALCHENNKDTSAQLAAARNDEANALDVVAEYSIARQQRLREVKEELANRKR